MSRRGQGHDSKRRKRNNYSDPAQAQHIMTAVRMLIEKGQRTNVLEMSEISGIPYNTLRDHYR